MIPLLGIFVFLFLSWLLSENRWQISLRPIVTGLILLFATSLFFLATPIGKQVQQYGGNAIIVLVQCADVGAAQIFNPKLISDANYLCPGLTFLPSIIFIGALTAVLYYIGVLQWIIRLFAFLVTRTMGVSGPEALIGASNIFLGMVEAPFMVKPYLKSFSRSQLFCMMTCGMASIAGGVMVVYSGFISRAGTQPGHLLIASILSVFAAILISKIVVPEIDLESGNSSMDKIEPIQDANIIDAACRGAGEGVKLAINVMAALIAFAALIALVNVILALFGNVSGEPLTLERIFGWIFFPMAWLIGIPTDQCAFAGQLLGEKTVLNEFLAYIDMTNPSNLENLSDRSRIIMSYALCGFANFGSLAIMVGGLGELAPERRKEIAQLAFPSLISGTFAALITACMAAFFV